MALTNAEKQKRYRERCRGNVTGNAAILQKILDELLWLRNQVTEMRAFGNAGNVTTPTPPYLKNPSDIDSCNQTGLPPLDSPRSIAGAKPAKKPATIPIDQWQPSPAHQQQALLAGHDGAWLVDQADRYRDWQHNTKRTHKDREAGFRNWIRNAPSYEVMSNGHANGQRKFSAVDNLFLGAARAAEAVANRQRSRSSPLTPLLDS